MQLRSLIVLSSAVALGSACSTRPMCPGLDDGNPCTDDVCSTSGAVTHSPSSIATRCDLGHCDGLGQCVGCTSNLDCAPSVCNLGTKMCSTQVGSCTDGQRNGDETGVDCGGSCAPQRQCATNGGCTVAMDCQSGLCNAGACAAPRCGDGVQQMTEGCDDGNAMNGDGCDDGPGGSCKPTGCGNGTTTGSETCDDGNMMNGDGCDNNCTVTRCGNGIAGGSETCDDGNAMGGDGCSAGCRVEPGFMCTGIPSVCISGCGDGMQSMSESCDDGNRMAGDGCSMNCQQESGFSCTGQPSTCTAVCGDGIPTPTEGCDDMGTAAGDGCSATCTVETGYQCAGTPSRCVTRCGDGILAGAEACDDTNIAGNDGCSPSCTIEPGYSCTGVPSVCVGNCGDGMRQGNEGCDDGNLANSDGCSSSCQVEPGSSCTGTPSVCTTVCGDGIRAGLEGCDDMNVMAGDGCSAGCTVEPGYSCMGTPSVCTVRCGDGAKAASEGCDDGNMMSGDGCSMSCTVEANYTCTGTNPSVCAGTCGDGILVAGEPCDDGNTTSGNGCSATCQVEFGFVCTGMPSMCTATCGDGLKASTEGCDDGDLMGGDGCSATCTTEVGWSCSGTMPSVCVMRVQTCGDGFVDAPEQCDDGNTRSVDGCSSSCRNEFTEVEPNEDGSPSTGGLGITGNDVNPTAITNANANGARLASNGDTAYLAAFTPAGDEDVFAITNDRAQSVTLRLDVWNRATGYGQGVACGTSIDTGMRVLNSSLTVLASNDDRNLAADRCSGLQMTMTPGQTVYAHVLEYNDDAAVTAYGLEIRFLVCGDGIVASPAEACDDGNSMNGDGCSSTCTIESGYQCSGQPSMCRPPENQCNDGMDNDLDGQSDCADTDCAAGCTSYFPACTAGQSLRVFNSGNVNLPIPDGSTTGVTSNINVTATGTVRRVAIKFNIIHDFDADLDLSFRGPTGPFLDASSDNGSTGFDYLNTVLDSTCSTPVTSGVAPFSACYSPEASFSGFNNASMTGTWSFKAADDFSLDTGTLSNWSLIMCTQ